MGLTSLLLGLLGDEVATSTAGRAWSAVVGSPEERAIEEALRNACAVVACDIATSGDIDSATAVLLEHVVGATPPALSASSPLSELESALSSAVQVLWVHDVEGEGVTHAESLGFSCTAEELVRRLTVALVNSLGLECDAASPLGALVVALGSERNRRDIADLRSSGSTSLSRSGSEEQATRVNAWISVNEDVPVVYVINGSDGPIFDVQPTPALIGYGPDGEILAMVGHSPSGLVRQIDPGSGWGWPMAHCRGWGGVASVKGQVHVRFTDASGQSWVLGHDRLVPDPPASAS